MSTPDTNAFATRLMDCESYRDDLRQRYETQKQALLERRLTPLQIALGWLSIVVSSGLILTAAPRLLSTANSAIPVWWWLDLTSAVGLFVLEVWLLRVLVRGGRVDWFDDRLYEILGCLLLAGMTFALDRAAISLDDPAAALQLHGCAHLLLLGGACGLVWQRLERTRKEFRVQLLELELRLQSERGASAP